MPEAEDAQTRKITRRTIAKGAAWSVPVIAASVAAPLAQASKPCNGSALINQATATFVNQDKWNAYYEWASVFRPNDHLRLTAHSTLTSTDGGQIGPVNLTEGVRDGAGTFGGVSGATRALQLVDIGPGQGTSNPGWVTVRTDFEWTYALPCAKFFPYTIPTVSFAIVDIDGIIAGDNSGGVERVWLNSAGSSGTIQNTSWLTGTGTPANPWRRAQNATGAFDQPNTSGIGRVNVTVSGQTGFSIGFRARATQAVGNNFAETIYVTNVNGSVLTPVPCGTAVPAC